MMTISYPEGTTVSGEIIKLDDFVVITRTYSNGVNLRMECQLISLDWKKSSTIKDTLVGVFVIIHYSQFFVKIN